MSFFINKPTPSALVFELFNIQLVHVPSVFYEVFVSFISDKLYSTGTTPLQDSRTEMNGIGLEPRSNGELQLYQVLQRANLLSYYETFISQGGDDVQQLCEAGEEEFLEIMSLVGMASKPLHVRRFQKTLQEWVTSPHLFKKIPNFVTNSHSPFVSSNSYSNPSEPYPRPSSVSTVSGLQKSGHAMVKETRSPAKRSLHENIVDRTQENHSQKLDEKTVRLIAKFARKELDERFSHRCSYDQAINQVKKRLIEEGEKTTRLHQIITCQQTDTSRPNLIRALESKNMEARNKEIRRQASLFPVHFSDRFSNTPLSLFELMCNEAAAHLCQAHPLLLVADRAERLEAAQSVVRKVEKETQQTQRSRLEFSSNGKFPGEADEIIAKLNGVKVKQDAFKQKIVAAESSKNYVHLLEYQTELNRLKQEEQALMRQKAKLLTQSGMLTGDLTRRNRKVFNGKNNVAKEVESSIFAEDRTSSSLLADLARAHNVFDCSNDTSLNSSEKNGDNASSSDRIIKQEIIDATLRSLVTKELSKPTSNEAIPLTKKAKLDT